MKTRTNILGVKSEQKDPDMRDISETNRIDMTWQLFGLQKWHKGRRGG